MGKFCHWGGGRGGERAGGSLLPSPPACTPSSLQLIKLLNKPCLGLCPWGGHGVVVLALSWGKKRGPAGAALVLCPGGDEHQARSWGSVLKGG